ncbi:MAG: hypothetical protein Q9176_000326 [Flavoplaca citrina]
MSFAFGDAFKGRGQRPSKPLRDVPYTEEFEAEYSSRMETQTSLRSYLVTLYNDRRALLASLSQASVSSNLPTSAAAVDPEGTGSGSKASVESSRGDNGSANEIPAFEVKNRPCVTLRDLDTREDGTLRTVRTDDEVAIRTAMRLVQTQKLDIANLQREIEWLELGNENLQMRLEGIDFGEEIKKRKAMMDERSDWEEIKVGESSKGMSEDSESIHASIEKDEHDNLEKAEKGRKDYIGSNPAIQEYLKYLEDPDSAQDYTKYLESQMAESVETVAKKRRIDQRIARGEKHVRYLESKNAYIKNGRDTDCSHGLPEGFEDTETQK